MSQTEIITILNNLIGGKLQGGGILIKMENSPKDMFVYDESLQIFFKNEYLKLYLINDWDKYTFFIKINEDEDILYQVFELFRSLKPSTNIIRDINKRLKRLIIIKKINGSKINI
jgi:hypothetical protein